MRPRVGEHYCAWFLSDRLDSEIVQIFQKPTAQRFKALPSTRPRVPKFSHTISLEPPVQNRRR